MSSDGSEKTVSIETDATPEDILAARVIIRDATQWRDFNSVSGPWGTADVEWDVECARRIDAVLAKLGGLIYKARKNDGRL